MANLLATPGAGGRIIRAMFAGAALHHAAREFDYKLDVDVRGLDTVSIVDMAALAITEAVVWAGLVPSATARHANPRTPEVMSDEILVDARAVPARMVGNVPPVPKADAQV